MFPLSMRYRWLIKCASLKQWTKETQRQEIVSNFLLDVWLWEEPFCVFCLVLVTVSLWITVRDESFLDQDFLHLLKFISSATGILIVHVSHSLKGCQLESVSIAKWAMTRGKCSIISDLEVFNLTIQHSDMMTSSSELLVELSEFSQHLFIRRIHCHRKFSNWVVWNSGDVYRTTVETDLRLCAANPIFIMREEIRLIALVNWHWQSLTTVHPSDLCHYSTWKRSQLQWNVCAFMRGEQQNASYRLN